MNVPLLVVVTAQVCRLELAEPKGHSGIDWLVSLLPLIEGQVSLSLLSIITLSQLLALKELSTGKEAPLREVSYWAPEPFRGDLSNKKMRGKERLRQEVKPRYF